MLPRERERDRERGRRRELKIFKGRSHLELFLASLQHNSRSNNGIEHATVVSASNEDGEKRSLEVAPDYRYYRYSSIILMPALCNVPVIPDSFTCLQTMPYRDESN